MKAADGAVGVAAEAAADVVAEAAADVVAEEALHQPGRNQPACRYHSSRHQRPHLDWCLYKKKPRTMTWYQMMKARAMRQLMEHPMRGA